MLSLPSIRKKVWLLPIVFVVCAFMVLPASAVLSSHAGSTPAGVVAAIPNPSAQNPDSIGFKAPPTPSPNLPSLSTKFPLASAVSGSSPESVWLKSLLHDQATSKSPLLTSLPNLEILEHPGPSVGATVSPFYQAEPAPMGLADYGLGAGGAYSYNTSHFESQVVFNTPPNATNPGSEGVIDPQGQNLGLVGSPYEFGLQLNTVTDNMTIPGSNDGSFWTQNVLDISNTGIHFVDDVFNFTGPTTVFGPGSVASGCNSNVNNILSVSHGVYQCVGGTIPISPANFPLTIQLYNNASVNALNQSQVTFGYRFVGAGGFLQTGITDTVAFVNPNATAPIHKAGFGVDGFTSTPSGELRDAELDLVGGIEGENAVFNSLNGTLSLLYSNASSGGWKNIPSAYNFGTDTGETSTGIAGFWTPSHTEEINQGPSFLYGLWNGLHWASVASGDIQFKGSITPAYGFVFVGNVAPLFGLNLSIVPTDAAGAFNTYLPPAVPIGGAAYVVQSFADAFAELNSTSFSTSQTSYTITLVPAPGLIRAPLYMNGNAQAKSLAKNVTGSSTAPYVFSGLTVSLDFAFNHLNDFHIPSFTVFQEQGVTTAVTVNDVFQGSNFAGGTYYWTDIAAPTGFLEPGPSITATMPMYSDQFQIFGSSGAHVSNETLLGSSYYSLALPVPLGGVIYLWQDIGASAFDITSVDGSYGVFVGDSAGVSVTNVFALAGSNGVDDVGSTQTTVWNDASDGSFAFSVYALSSSHGTYSWINSSFGATGVYAGGYLGSSYYSLPGATAASVNNLNSTAGAIGATLYESNGVTFTHVSSDGFLGSTEGIVGFYVNNIAVQDLTVSYGTDPGAAFLYATGITVTNARVNDSFGVATVNADPVVVTGVTAVTDALGTEFVNTTGITVSNVNASYGSEGIVTVDSSTVGVTGVSASHASLGAVFDSTDGVTVTTASASDSAGVELEACPGPNTITGVSATDFSSAGVVLFDSSSTTVTGVTASDHSVGIIVDPSMNVTISGVVATGFTYGTVIEGSSAVTVSGTVASDFSVGDIIEGSTMVTDTSATVSDLSAGVVVEHSNFTTVTGTRASNTTQSNVYSTSAEVGFPLAAVVTESTQTTIVSNVTATHYGAALYDVASNGLQVSDVNGTGDQYAIVLNGTFNSYFSGIGAFRDWVGLVMQGAVFAEDNVVSGSSFVDDTSFGVAILSGGYNTFTENNFIGDNGATATYNAAHIQAWSGYYNSFNTCSNSACSAGVGNYWSDWHTYGSNGYLAPYFITGETWDYFPLGPQQTFDVNFHATGLPSGATWSVTLGGVTESSSSTTITFAEPMGTYAYGVGALAGWASSPSSGSVTVTGAAYNVSVTFSALVYAVTLSAGGLAASTVWSATVNGGTESTSGPSLMFWLPNGNYTFAFHNVSGYTLPGTGASGSFAVAGAPLSLGTTYAPAATPPSLVSTNTYNTGFAVAVALAVIALLVGLIALFWRRQKKEPVSAPPAVWTPPAGTEGPVENSSPGWSEGPVNPPP